MRRIGPPAFAALMAVFALAPLYWMTVASVVPGKSQLASGNPWWPEAVTLQHYADALADPDFARLAVNTAVVTLATVATSTVASLLAAFALAYLGAPRARAIALSLFASYLVPQVVLFLPLALMLSRLHLTDTLWALVLTYPGLVVPFGTWVLWNLFRHLPRDYVDLARLEGAGPARLLAQVLIPLALPALAAVALFAVAVVFNDALYAFTLVTTPESTTLMADVGSTLLDVGDPGLTFAEILLGMAPAVLVCAWFADTYARGLGTGVIADA